MPRLVSIGSATATQVVLPDGLPSSAATRNITLLSDDQYHQIDPAVFKSGALLDLGAQTDSVEPGVVSKTTRVNTPQTYTIATGFKIAVVLVKTASSGSSPTLGGVFKAAGTVTVLTDGVTKNVVTLSTDDVLVLEST